MANMKLSQHMKKVEKKEPKREERKEARLSPKARSKMEKSEAMGFKSGGKVSRKGC